MKKFLLFLALGSTSFTSWAVKETIALVQELQANYKKAIDNYKNAIDDFPKAFQNAMKELDSLLKGPLAESAIRVEKGDPEEDTNFYIPEKYFGDVQTYIRSSRCYLEERGLFTIMRLLKTIETANRVFQEGENGNPLDCKVITKCPYPLPSCHFDEYDRNDLQRASIRARFDPQNHSAFMAPLNRLHFPLVKKALKCATAARKYGEDSKDSKFPKERAQKLCDIFCEPMSAWKAVVATGNPDCFQSRFNINLRKRLNFDTKTYPAFNKRYSLFLTGFDDFLGDIVVVKKDDPVWKIINKILPYIYLGKVGVTYYIEGKMSPKVEASFEKTLDHLEKEVPICIYRATEAIQSLKAGPKEKTLYDLEKVLAPIGEFANKELGCGWKFPEKDGGDALDFGELVFLDKGGKELEKDPRKEVPDEKLQEVFGVGEEVKELKKTVEAMGKEIDRLNREREKERKERKEMNHAMEKMNHEMEEMKTLLKKRKGSDEKLEEDYGTMKKFKPNEDKK